MNLYTYPHLEVSNMVVDTNLDDECNKYNADIAPYP